MSTKPGAVLIEDDFNARKTLANLIQEDNRLEIVGEGGKVEDAITLIRRNKPAIAFLDVELENKTIFDILGQLTEQDHFPMLVFTTGFDKYAVQAIKHSAFDFLLKPIERKELKTCIDRLLGKTRVNDFKQQIEMLLDHFKPSNNLKFNIRSGLIFIDPSEIFFIHADWNYSEIYLSLESKEIVSIQLGKLEEMLMPYDNFIRVSRSHIINKFYLKKVNTLTRNCTLVKSGETANIKVSLSHLLALKKL